MSEPNTVDARRQNDPRQYLRTFWWVTLTVVAFHVGLFIACCALLASQASTIESEFAQDAMREHGGYILLSSLALLRGYALISMLYVAALFPMVLLWMRGRTFKRWSVVWRTLFLTFTCLALLFLRLMALRPYFVTQWLPEWHFQIVPGAPGLMKDIATWIIFNGVPLAAIGAIAWFWIRSAVRWVQNFSMAKLRMGRISVALLVLIGLWMTPRAIRAFTPESAPRMNVLIIASDSLRADHLSCNGYHRTTSPNIDALAARSVNFQNCMTPVGSTLESMVGMLSSQYPHTHGLRQMFPDRATVEHVNAHAPKLPEILRDAGYDTAVVGDWCAAIFNEVPMGYEHVQVSPFDSFRIWLSEAVYLSHPVIPLYFDNKFGYWFFPKLQSFAHYLRPEVLTDRVIERIEKRSDKDQPFFYTMFTGTNHFAYHAPYPYYKKWSNPEYRGANQYQVHFDVQAFMSDPNWDEAFAKLSDAEKQHIIDLYDGCVTRFDDCVGRILETLEKRDLLDNTIVIITSDHGEDLFEPNTTLTHGISFNGGDQGNHVPLIAHIPGQKPHQVKELVRNIDIAPTLLQLLDLPEEPRFEGASLEPYVRGRDEKLNLALYGETGYPFVQRKVPGETSSQIPALDAATFVDEHFDFHIVLRPEYVPAVIYSKERCLRTEEWKLVFTPGEHHLIHRLYHLPSDPHCEKDVASANPRVYQRMKSYLWRWILNGEQHSTDVIHGTEPTPVPEIPPAYKKVPWPDLQSIPTG